MACPLPPELLDHIIDHLHDDPTTLKACCVVAKSWVPRTQSHLFARVEFDAGQKRPLESWMKIFPDPSNSPAHHTRSLLIRGTPDVAVPVVDIGGWIRAFHNLVHLHLDDWTWGGHQAPLVPFHGLSPTVRSLRLTSTSFEVFDLVCSFPLLEDLALVAILPECGAVRLKTPASSPKLTGSLDLKSLPGNRPAVCRLLDLPNGLHFRAITTLCLNEEDIGPATDLVSRCSSTLESFTLYLMGTTGVPPLDLSRATKLKDLTFRCRISGIKSITMALQTVGSENLRQITIYPYTKTSDHPIEEAARQDWRDLDLLLVRLWTSRSIRPRLMYGPDAGGKEAGDYAPSLLPELTRRGVIDLAKRPLGITIWG